MTIDTAIDILTERRTCMECVRGNGSCEDCDNAFDMAIKALEDSRWIPVTERLPDKEHTKYVVTLDNGEVENRWWLGCFWVESVGKVTAWKPLPKPYEGSEEE